MSKLRSKARHSGGSTHLLYDKLNMLGFCVVVVALTIVVVFGQNNSDSSCLITTQHLSDPPYENFFYSDCNVDTQVVVTSPLPNSNLSIIGPRLIVAWPAGNSGMCTFFQPLSGPNGSLAIELVNSTYGAPLGPADEEVSGSGYPFVGIKGVISFNTSTELTLAILGSVRTIRDFTEGPSLLRPVIQNAINVTQFNTTGVSFSRLWLDNITTTMFTLTPYENSGNSIKVQPDNKTASFGSGFYAFSTSFNYPQLEQLSPEEVLNNQSQGLAANYSSQTTSLSFMSYTEKLLAGAWRFLTYFGRDSMISALLLQPVLSTGNGSALEAVLGAVLERINRTDGSVCHEETIGDYATYLNLLNDITSSAAGFTYPMIDTDFYLPILMDLYFNKFPDRVEPLLSQAAGSVDVTNFNLTYRDLALRNVEKIMNITAAFALNQTVDNLIHLKPGEIVGEWRDSTFGLGNGRVPFDVNAALVPAALRAIAQLVAIPNIFSNASSSTIDFESWQTVANDRADIWEFHVLPFFEYNLTISEATNRLDQFTSTVTFYDGPANDDSFSVYSNTNNNSGTQVITSYAIALNGNDLNPLISEQKIPVIHTDTGYHLFFLNITNPGPEAQFQYTRFINATANEILRPFPAGLTTPVGLVVANPALSGDDMLIANFTNSAYHGTVVWSWQLALMAKGLERQLDRCNGNATDTNSTVPAFCEDESVYTTVLSAYNVLWDTIEANSAQLQSEVWSWTYDNSTDEYTTVPLGALPPPPGVSGGTESNVRQLWSLTFLAVTRNKALSMDD